jgi:hypothetical protein
MSDDQYSPLVPDQTFLNEVKYAARDFVSIADDLLRRLKIEYGTVYNDYASTSQGIMLRDLVAWAYAALTWYLDRTASDCFLSTARTRSAVERLVEQIAYKMTPASPAGTTLVLTFPGGTTSGFIMKDRWRFQGPNGLTFESYAKITQSSALSEGATINVDVRQGDTRILTYTANGSKNQTYRLANILEDRFLAVDATEVWVDGQLWEEKDFLEYEKTNHYEISYLANPPIIRFGDGLAGNIPASGSEIKIRFLIIDGKNGNVRSNTIQSSIDTLTINGQPVLFDVNNTNRAVGGLDPEDAEKAKRLAPSSFAARGAAITQQDYEALSNSFVDPAYGAVAKAYAVNPRSFYSDTVFNALVVDIQTLLLSFSSIIGAMEESVIIDAASLTTALASIETSVDELDTLRQQIYSWSGAASAGASSARSSMNEASSRSTLAMNLANDAINTGEALVQYIQDGNTNIDHILAEVNNMLVDITGSHQESTQAASVASSASSAIENVVLLNSNNIMNATNTDGAVDIEVNNIVSQISSLAIRISNIQSTLSSIDGNFDSLSSQINLIMSDMKDRIGVLFSDDCLSNYVQVPILSLDLDGNYSSPSIGLRSALQEYLDGIKEVTQVVEVVDGISVLILADISIKVKIIEAYVISEVKSQIESVVISLLKGREFNQPLYLSDLYDIVTESSAGINYVNISITGPTDYLVDGNLIPDSNQVIVLGSLVIKNEIGEIL